MLAHILIGFGAGVLAGAAIDKLTSPAPSPSGAHVAGLVWPWCVQAEAQRLVNAQHAQRPAQRAQRPAPQLSQRVSHRQYVPPPPPACCTYACCDYYYDDGGEYEYAQ